MIPLVISKFKKLSKKEENKELFKHSMLSLIVRMGGAGAAFLMNIVVARYIGAHESGYIFLGIAVSTMLATFGRVGADATVLRFVSVYDAESNRGKARAVMHTMLKWSYI